MKTKKTLLRFLLFFGFVFMLVCIISFAHFKLLKHFQTKPRSINDKTHVLIFGDSHAQTSFNPALLKGCENYSSSSENLFYSFFKIKYILDHYKNKENINTILLSISYYSLLKNAEDKMYAGEEVEVNYDRYFNLLDDEGKMTLLSNSDKLNFYYLKYQLGFPIDFDRTVKVMNLSKSTPYYVDGFIKKDNSNLGIQNFKRARARHYYDKQGEVSAFSETLKNYLNKIVLLCNQKKIALILVNTPLHPYYKNLVPSGIFAQFNNSINTITSRNTNVTYWNYSSLNIPTEAYGDCDHLNYKGAQLFSKIISSRLYAFHH